MSDLIRCRGRASRFLAVTFGVLMVFSLGLLTAAPATADPIDQMNFNPDDDPPDATGDTEFMVMSDQNDGTNSTFHVVTVATVDTTAVDWYYCPLGYGGADPTAGGSGCTLAGTDSSPVTPPGPGTDGPDEVYELAFDVPDDAVHDWIAWVCAGVPKNDTNCDQEKEEDVQFDDASTGTAASQSPAGEITLPTMAFGAGSNGQTLGATTTPDVTEVGWCWINDADADTDPDGTCDDLHTDSAPDNPAAQQSQFKVWSDTTSSNCSPCEGTWVLFELAGGATNSLPGGSDNCTGSANDCQLDSHYQTESPSVPTTVELAFPDSPDGEPSTLPNDCGETEAVNTISLPSPTLGNAVADETIQGCILDQAGEFITDNEDWAFHLSPEDADATTTHKLGYCMGGTSADEGDCNDTNTNNFNEQVAGDPGDAGDIAEQDFDLHTIGTYNAKFCVDDDDNADDGAGQAADPCAGEALVATGTITVSAPVDHVHLKKAGTEGPLCHTGASSTTAPAASVVNLTGCTLGTIGSTGNEQPSGGNHVLWITNPAGNPDDPAQVTSQENTTGADGKADAAVTSGVGAAEKTSTIRFCLDNFPNPAGTGLGNGICDGLETGSGFGSATIADFQINWTKATGQQGACPNGLNRIRGNNDNNLLIGTADCDSIRGRSGNDTLRGKAGDDRLNGGRDFDRGNGGVGTDRCRRLERKRACEN